MKRMFIRVLMVSGVALVSSALALAQRQMSPQQQQQPAGSAQQQNPGLNTPTMQQQQQNQATSLMRDKEFLRKAMQGGMGEVQLGQLAQQKATSPDVKQFGAKMVQDHSQLNDQLKPVAAQMDVKEPTKLSKKDEKLDAKLQNLSGAQFDDAYIKTMIKDHENDLTEFRQEAEYTQNPQLKQAAQQGAQLIDQHLRAIKQIAKSHGVKG